MKASPALPLLGFPGKLPKASDLPPRERQGATQRLLGFWVMWHRYGGVHELIASGFVAASSVYRQINEFRDMFGVDVWDVPSEFPLYPVLVDDATDQELWPDEDPE